MHPRLFPVAALTAVLGLQVLASAQCQFATSASFEPPPPFPLNPLQLTTAEPAPFLEPGSDLRLVGSGAPQGWLHRVFYGQSATAVPLPPPVVGVGLILPLDALASQTVPDWTVPIPPGLPAGVPLYFQYLATNGLEVQLSNGLELFSGLHAPEIEVLSVAPVGTPKGGDQNHPFAVTVRNNGNQGSAFTLRVCVGNSCDNEVFTLDAGQTSTVQVAVDIPPVPTTCGVKTNFTVQAEALVTDCVPANDDLAMTLGIAAPHWDLRLEVLNAPAQTWQGSPFSWQVRVTNVGNVTSHDVCLRTAMIPVPGPNDWSAPVCLYFFDSGNVAPGASKTFHFQCTAPCFSFLGTQWIKAGLRAGCFDDCSVGNFDQDSLLVNDGC